MSGEPEDVRPARLSQESLDSGGDDIPADQIHAGVASVARAIEALSAAGFEMNEACRIATTLRRHDLLFSADEIADARESEGLLMVRNGENALQNMARELDLHFDARAAEIRREASPKVDDGFMFGEVVSNRRAYAETRRDELNRTRRFVRSVLNSASVTS